MPVEAGGSVAPAQNAYCSKICSKIITSQFCIIMLNNDEKDNVEIPNANVNMEYGLMLGFNKYVIPFQRDSQKLPFNVAGLDTIKYGNRDFEKKAIDVINQAIKETTQDELPKTSPDQLYQIFFLHRNLLMSAVDSEGEKNLYRMGDTLGFNLLHDFSGDKYIYFGKFSSLRPEVVLWRVRKMINILDSRKAGIPNRVAQGVILEEHVEFVNKMFDEIKIWVAVTSDDDKNQIVSELKKTPNDYNVEVFSINDITLEIQELNA